MEQDDRDLNRLFVSYRDSCEAPEPTSDFMPQIWRLVDARRKSVRTWRRWTGAFVAAAATLCVVMVIYMSIPVRPEPIFTTTYIDTFEQVNYETLAYSEITAEPREAPEIR